MWCCDSISYILCLMWMTCEKGEYNSVFRIQTIVLLSLSNTVKTRCLKHWNLIRFIRRKYFYISDKSHVIRLNYKFFFYFNENFFHRLLKESSEKLFWEHYETVNLRRKIFVRIHSFSISPGICARNLKYSCFAVLYNVRYTIRAYNTIFETWFWVFSIKKRVYLFYQMQAYTLFRISFS